MNANARFDPSKWSTPHCPTSRSVRFTDFESSTNVSESLNAALNKHIPKSETLDLPKAIKCLRDFKRQKISDLLYLTTFDRLPATKKRVNVRQILRKT